MRLLGHSLTLIASLLGFVVTPWLAQTGNMYWCGVTSTVFVVTLVFGYYITLCLDE